MTGLGLKYHLMTDYTSFVAVDTIIRETGEVVTVKQPLPLPQGVSDYAAGGGFAGRQMLKCSSYAPAPMSLLCEEDKITTGQGETELRIYLTGATLPPEITLAQIEKIMLNRIEDDLVKIARKWELKSLSISLKVEKGKVMTVSIKSYRGKTCQDELLEKLFKKLTFNTDFHSAISVT